MRRRQLEKQRQAIISRALKDVDSVTTSKKIVFDSDSEDECIEQVCTSYSRVPGVSYLT